MTPGGLSGRARAGWTLADQVVVSARNFALLWLFIKTTDSVSVGTFGIIYTTYFLAMAVVRGFAGDPLVVRFSGASPRSLARATSSSLVVVVVLSAVSAALLSLPLALSRDPLWIGLSVLGSTLFLLLAQDHLRLAMFAGSRPDHATANDVGVLGVLVLLLLALAHEHQVSIPLVLLAWGAASLAGALAAIRQLGVTLSGSEWRDWLRDHVDLGPAFAADAVSNRGAEQVSNVAVSLVAGLTALGSITACRTLFAPLTTIQTGVNAFLMPEVSRRAARHDVSRLRHMVDAISCGLGLIMILTGALLLLVPPEFGERIFAGNWGGAADLIVPMTAFSALNAVGFGYWAAMKALSRARRTLVVRTAGGLAGVVAATIGATRGAAGATWGMSAGALVTACWLGWEFRRELVRREVVHVAS